MVKCGLPTDIQIRREDAYGASNGMRVGLKGGREKRASWPLEGTKTDGLTEKTLSREETMSIEHKCTALSAVCGDKWQLTTTMFMRAQQCLNFQQMHINEFAICYSSLKHNLCWSRLWQTRICKNKTSNWDERTYLKRDCHHLLNLTAITIILALSTPQSALLTTTYGLLCTWVTE